MRGTIASCPIRWPGFSSVASAAPRCTTRSVTGAQTQIKIVVFAAARPGVAEHEVVHAYCGQTFGTTGPLWYREGMAQLLTCGQDNDRTAWTFHRRSWSA